MLSPKPCVSSELASAGGTTDVEAVNEMSALRRAALSTGPRLEFFRCIGARMQELMARRAAAAAIQGQTISNVAVRPLEPHVSKV